jgi:hypothetical protein
MTTKPKKPRAVATLTTPRLMEVAGVTRRQVQFLELAGIAPLRRGKGGPGNAARWSIMQAVAAAYFRAFLDAGLHPSWAYAAARWVAAQHPGPLAEAFALGRTLLALCPDGRGVLVEPYLKPGATRAQRLSVAQLNLRKTYDRVLRKVEELAVRTARREAARGGSAASCREKEPPPPKPFVIPKRK